MSADSPEHTPQLPEKSLLRRIFSLRMLACLVLGFSSGMPLYVLLSLISAWLRSEGVDLRLIGVLSLIMIPYTWKFLWAPLLDRYSIPGFGRRKTWIVLTQAVLIASIAFFGFFNPPAASMSSISLLALLVSFASATQDIAIDAYRREILDNEELGLGNALFVNAYRIAGLVPGGISLILAQFIPWTWVFVLTAACLVPGFCFSLWIKERPSEKVPTTLKQAVVEPWREFIRRRGLMHAFMVILFVFLYKLGDSMATALATPFYIDLGYDLMTIGIVAKNIGLWSMVVGGLAGGVIMLKLGINRSLWVFGFGQLITIAGFVILAGQGQNGTPPLWLFSLVIGGEALGAGLGTAAFVAFIASQTCRAYTATQFALLTSLSAVPRTFCNASTGFLVEYLGWEHFFMLCILLAVPGMLLLFRAAPWHERVSGADAAPAGAATAATGSENAITLQRPRLQPRTWEMPAAPASAAAAGAATAAGTTAPAAASEGSTAGTPSKKEP